eukprot:599832-Pleurochrysis_carterae.AAC.1
MLLRPSATGWTSFSSLRGEFRTLTNQLTHPTYCHRHFCACRSIRNDIKPCTTLIFVVVAGMLAVTWPYTNLHFVSEVLVGVKLVATLAACAWRAVAPLWDVLPGTVEFTWQVLARMAMSRQA